MTSTTGVLYCTRCHRARREVGVYCTACATIVAEDAQSIDLLLGLTPSETGETVTLNDPPYTAVFQMAPRHGWTRLDRAGRKWRQTR